MAGSKDNLAAELAPAIIAERVREKQRARKKQRARHLLRQLILLRFL